MLRLAAALLMLFACTPEAPVALYRVAMPECRDQVAELFRARLRNRGVQRFEITAQGTDLIEARGPSHNEWAWLLTLPAALSVTRDGYPEITESMLSDIRPVRGEKEGEWRLALVPDSISRRHVNEGSGFLTVKLDKETFTIAPGDELVLPRALDRVSAWDLAAALKAGRLPCAVQRVR